MVEGSSATDSLSEDVTDVTDVRKKEEEGKLTGSLALAGNRDPESEPRLQKNRRHSKSEMRSQALPGNDENEEKTTFYKICLLPKLIIHQRQKRP